jgi:hypothetical protein
MARPYENYLKSLASWPSALASASQWWMMFDIDSVPALQQDLTKRLNAFENNFGANGGWHVDGQSVSKLTDGEYNYQDGIGCVFARQVNLPTDGIEAGNTGLDYGGFLPPATSNTRNKYSKLRVTFLETNASFVDLVIRPWLILTSYYGLISRESDSPKNVKCSWCDVYLMARVGSGLKQEIRKIYRFNNIAPVSIDGEQYSYMADDMKYTSVDFVYDQYYVRDAETPNLLQLKNDIIT